MRIGIIGAGAMAAALGGGWAAAGHEVVIGARSAESARELAGRITATLGDTSPRRGTGTHTTEMPGIAESEPTSPIAVRAAGIGAAIAGADIVLMAVPVSALTELLAEHGSALAGKVVIDCTNAFLPDDAAPEGVTAFVLSEDAVAERIAAGAPKAHVVKAFNLLAAEVWAGTDRIFDGARLAVPICGDNPDAIATVATLAEDLALQPFPAGGLHQARYLEATSVFTVGLWFSGADARAMLPPLSAAFAVADA
ncbi:NADPH-dependent F420 reductase [Nocardia rhizosphaerihabitans]|uniref:NADP oxidoreductase n=1 Tax=Nocardia rhizosphaerihabitans TaxID=1691570 RepID=A0ABQ2K9A9_9NOCA|nr:NAD(P)-binding domain-containing protein [Nocardia rhizosphaerihabitans]GGN73119.1 NADP oxidoreductase [Nocardia rhizosphaerihabitans]